MSVLTPPALRRLARAGASAARFAARFARRDEAATMAEYALLVGCIALIALAGAKALGANLATKFTNEAARVANP